MLENDIPVLVRHGELPPVQLKSIKWRDIIANPIEKTGEQHICITNRDDTESCTNINIFATKIMGFKVYGDAILYNVK